MRGWQQELSSWRDEAAAKTMMLSRERGGRNTAPYLFCVPLTKPNLTPAIKEVWARVTSRSVLRLRVGKMMGGGINGQCNRDVKGDSEEALLKAVFEVS